LVRDKVLYAAENCQAIDGDGDYGVDYEIWSDQEDD